MSRDTVIVFPSDTHSGSPVGLMPPGQWAFTNGGYHDPDETQALIYRLWEAGWKRVKEARKGKRLIVVHVGDAVEGSHHNSVETITPRVDEHERIHIAVMERALQLSDFNPEGGDLLYYVKGTPAHVGQGGQSEERIARQFDGAMPRVMPKDDSGQDGSYLWDHLRLKVNGRLFDIAHHGGSVGGRPWTKTDALRGKLKEIYYRAIEAGTRPPDVWLRADRHEATHDIYISATGTHISGFITPAFQAKTEYGWKVAADRPATLGLLWMEVTAGGHIAPFWEKAEIEQDEVVEL